MLLTDGPLTLREFAMSESLPLATVFQAVLSFLAGRADVVVCGAHAVNAYCDTERMTADLDVLSTDAAELAESLRMLLAERFRIAARVRETAPGSFRVYEVRTPKNRRLVDVRQVQALPAHRSFADVQVVEPVELAAMKAISLANRKGREKGLSDRLDLHRLLRALPELRVEDGAVAQQMRARGASDAALAAWLEVVREPLEADDDEDDE